MSDLSQKEKHSATVLALNVKPFAKGGAQHRSS